MCGRYWLKSEKKKIVNEFNIYEVMADVKPDYNITPGRNVLCITKNGNNKLVSMRWGLIPSWAKDEKIAYRTINARAESLIEKPSFLRPFQSQRCLIIADGFYEWQKDAHRKIPYAITLKNNKPFAFAGLYDHWQSPDNEIIATCTIITTKANQLLASIHNRMPVILPKTAYEIWLDKNFQDIKKLSSLLIPFDDLQMHIYQVSDLVNSVKNNSPSLLQPANK